MKRQYIQPLTTAMQIENTQMMAGSETLTINEGGTVTEWGAKEGAGFDYGFYADEERAEKNEYKAFSLWED